MRGGGLAVYRDPVRPHGDGWRRDDERRFVPRDLVGDDGRDDVSFGGADGPGLCGRHAIARSGDDAQHRIRAWLHRCLDCGRARTPDCLASLQPHVDSHTVMATACWRGCDRSRRRVPVHTIEVHVPKPLPLAPGFHPHPRLRALREQDEQVRRMVCTASAAAGR